MPNLGQTGKKGKELSKGKERMGLFVYNTYHCLVISKHYKIPAKIYLAKHLSLREGCTNENPEKVWSFAKLGGGGVSEGSKMPNLYFGKVFFSVSM